MRPIIAVVLFASLAGCGGESSPPRRAVAAAEPDVRKPVTDVIAVRRVALDGKPAGYLKTKVTTEPPPRGSAAGPRETITYWVYDERFGERGWFTEGGRTFRFGLRLAPEDLGILPHDLALRRLLDGPEEAAVDLLPIEAPRTLEGDREAAAKKAAEEAKKKAEEAAASAGGEGGSE